MNIAIIVFAGKGTRINSKTPKQFIKVNGKDVVAYTIDVFEKHPLIDGIILVTSEEYLAYTKNMVFSNRYSKIYNVVAGGKTRQESVRNGLNSMNYGEDDYALIHDGDRPFIKDSIITDSIMALRKYDAVTVAIKSEEGMDGVKNLGRKIIKDGVSYDVQTPQSFRYTLIKDAHNKLKDEEFVDDASLIEKEGGYVHLIDGDPMNFKITTDEDLAFFKKEIGKR